jgi:hypothetical protein
MVTESDARALSGKRSYPNLALVMSPNAIFVGQPATPGVMS